MLEKIKVLSSTIVNYSLEVKENDRVLIESALIAKPLLVELVKKISEVGGIPFVRITDSGIRTLEQELATSSRIPLMKAQDQFDIDNFDCFIHIRYLDNEYNSKNITKEFRKELGEATKDIRNIRVNDRRWTLLNYPSDLDAFKAHMTTEEFQKYAMDVMTIDYKKMADMIEPLKQLMEKTDKVRMVGPNTDITFSIKGIPAIPCCGKANIPDGECYTAPVRDSVNGTITFNTPCPYQGNIYTNVSLTFKDGKIVEATCNEDNEKLNEIFDTDEGARYVGEFSFGLNPEIKNPMGDILYDEKIIGSIHFTPGAAYEDAFNGNESSIHWDMVLVQREDYGGGEVYFDDVLIRKDGEFVLEELKPLNYK
ncbi:MAG: aminopeptidase [Firmicutes bacterium]|nr:aminopeptidase [Bacillota bacterium]